MVLLVSTGNVLMLIFNQYSCSHLRIILGFDFSPFSFQPDGTHVENMLRTHSFNQCMRTHRAQYRYIEIALGGEQGALLLLSCLWSTRYTGLLLPGLSPGLLL
jgi:hypothetical protein